MHHARNKRLDKIQEILRQELSHNNAHAAFLEVLKMDIINQEIILYLLQDPEQTNLTFPSEYGQIQWLDLLLIGNFLEKYFPQINKMRYIEIECSSSSPEETITNIMYHNPRNDSFAIQLTGNASKIQEIALMINEIRLRDILPILDALDDISEASTKVPTNSDCSQSETSEAPKRCDMETLHTAPESSIVRFYIALGAPLPPDVPPVKSSWITKSEQDGNNNARITTR